MKIYPPVTKNQQLKYSTFISHAQKCYLSLTGGSIHLFTQILKEILKSVFPVMAAAMTKATKFRLLNTPILISWRRSTSKNRNQWSQVSVQLKIIIFRVENKKGGTKINLSLKTLKRELRLINPLKNLISLSQSIEQAAQPTNISQMCVVQRVQ